MKADVGRWKVPEEKSPNSSLQPSWLQMQTETWVKSKGDPFILLLSYVGENRYTHLSLAPTDAVVCTTDPMAAGLWNLPMRLAVVEAAPLVSRTYAGISLYKVGHLAVESSTRVGEVK